MTSPSPGAWRLWLFPTTPRDFPGRRPLRIALRALHTLAGGVLLGGHIFAAGRADLLPWLLLTACSGALILATDLHASFACLLEVRGLLVITKIALVLAVAPLWPARIWLLATVIILGVAGSHASGRVRHRLLFSPGPITVDRRKG